LSLSNASSFRRTLAGLCLLVGPVLLVAASITDPASGGGDNDKEYLQSLKDDPDMVQLSTAFWIAGFATLVGGVVGLVHVIRERGVVLANLGGTLAILGLVMFVALVTTTIYELNNVEHLPLDTADKLSNDIEDYWVGYIILVPALLGTFIGVILLGAAVLRSKLAHPAAGVLMIVGMLALFGSDGGDVVGIIANALLAAGFGLVGLKLLGMTDEQWDGRARLAAPAGASAPAVPPGPEAPPPPYA